MFEQVVIMKREISFSPLLGLKGLKEDLVYPTPTNNSQTTANQTLLESVVKSQL